MFEERRPAGVTVLAILVAIAGAGALALGIVSIIGAGATWLGKGDTSALPATVTGVFYLAVAAVTLFVAWALMNLRPWAWMLAVAVVAVQLAGHLVSALGQDLGWLQAILASIVPILVLFYLFRPNVRAAFH
jgi:hypothetical protein